MTRLCNENERFQLYLFLVRLSSSGSSRRSLLFASLSVKYSLHVVAQLELYARLAQQEAPELHRCSRSSPLLVADLSLKLECHLGTSQRRRRDVRSLVASPTTGRETLSFSFRSRSRSDRLNVHERAIVPAPSRSPRSPLPLRVHRAEHPARLRPGRPTVPADAPPVRQLAARGHGDAAVDEGAGDQVEAH